MSALTDRTPAATYGDLLHIEHAGLGLDSSSRAIQDGLGNSSTLSLSTAGVANSGTLTQSGAATFSSDLTVSGTLILSGLASSTGLIAHVGSGTLTPRTLTGPAAGISVSNGNGVSGNPTLALANDLAALEGLSSTGLIARTATDTAAVRTLTGPAAGVSVSNGDGVSGNPTIALANDLAAVEALSSTGIAVRTTTDTWAQRTLTGPAAGISVSNGDGVSGNPTLALANDLAALEALSSTGLAVRTGSDAWAQRTVTAGNGITVTNGDGASGNPTVACAFDSTAPAALAATASSGASTTPARLDHVHQRPLESIIIACSDETTALTTGTAKVTFIMPYAFTVTAVIASLTTAQTSGSIFTVDINEAGTSIISTKLTIDNGETDSSTAATPAVISDSSLAQYAKITVDIDQVGDGTAKGLKVYLVGRQS